jgi:hypothetical protein
MGQSVGEPSVPSPLFTKERNLIRRNDSHGVGHPMRYRKMAKQEHGHIVETAVEARGAERGPTVRNVLVWSIGLVVAAFAVIYFLYFKT